MLSRQIASKLRGYETPFYLYDMALLRQTLESVVYESKKYGYKVHYANKANYDDHLLAIIREYGLGIDCASGNELRKAVEAGFDPKGIVYAGVGKRDRELRYAIEQGILAINCESIEELHVVDGFAAEEGRVADVFTNPKSDIARELVLPQERPVLDPTTGGRKLRLIFNGEDTQKPVISEMILACRGPVNVLFADTKSGEGAAYGHMILELPNDEHDAEKVVSWLKNSGLTWKEER